MANTLFGNRDGEYHVSLCAENERDSFEIGDWTTKSEVLRVIQLLTGEKQ